MDRLPRLFPLSIGLFGLQLSLKYSARNLNTKTAEERKEPVVNSRALAGLGLENFGPRRHRRHRQIKTSWRPAFAGFALKSAGSGQASSFAHARYRIQCFIFI